MNKRETSSDSVRAESQNEGTATPRKSTKRAVAKPTAAETTAVIASQPIVESSEERSQRIALRAYYRAEARGFAPGAELDDWIAAEDEIDGARP